MNEPLGPHEEKLIRSIRDPLTYFAAERTLLMWIRTGAVLMALGFIVDRFGVVLQVARLQAPSIPISHPRWSFWFGLGFILLGAVVNAMAAERYRRFHYRFEHGDASPGKGVLVAVALGLLLTGAGLALALYLLLLNP